MASKVQPESLKPPIWTRFLGKGQVARDAAAYWREIVPRLEEAGVLSGLDTAVVTEACTCWARIQQMEREVSNGYTAESGRADRGAQKAPALTALNQYRTAFKFYVSELGLSPTSRARMNLPKGDDADLDLD